ncbi:Nitrogen regulation protein NtrY [Caenispirillum salinarum AK4]|uniref:Nitrogen regulation protein n=1 Tax=Caenispirillum salinarum AK4 TaxID=1238182 RepID=K9H787_9PROT|nr:PAS domain-containing sensor histidine kinase [Caenispirillum salinarum]EKV26488.1 Nitrogen regulation protein NtrY [Caenispirillum salinarum AK4]
MSSDPTSAPSTSSASRVTLKRTFLRLGLWARHVNLGRRLAILLTLAAIASGAGTYVVMTDQGTSAAESNTLYLLLMADLVLLLVLTVIVVRRIVRVWLEHRSGTAGSRLHVRLVLLFSAVAVTPTVLVAIFSALFFNLGVQTWFGERVRTALDESQAVARAYMEEHRQAVAGEVLSVASDINRQWTQLARSTQQLERFLEAQASIRGLSEAIMFSPDGKVFARAGFTFALQFEDVPFWALERANNGEVAVLTGETDDRVRALVRLDTTPASYLYVGRFVDPQVINHMEATEKAVSEYKTLQGQQSGLEITFALIFMIVAMLLLLAAVWVGLTLATRLASPIVALINAAERVRGGDLSVRVPEIAASDEVASLGRAFNRMTSQIANQHHRLTLTNRELDERRRFTETVLEGVSAGVIGTDAEGRITLPNRGAGMLLHTDLHAWSGWPVGEAIPEFAELMDEVAQRPDRTLQREIVVRRGNRPLTLLVRVTAEEMDGQVVGHVLTFDDITELQSAQRKAAWADVARRIAHEIKNPLTPIQLSAERLKRKYLKQVTEDGETFSKLTDTIVRHVGDIGQMVDEFSAFARMPQPVMKAENMVELVRHAVFSQRTAHPAIDFTLDLPSHRVPLECDSRQVGQALTNLLKNAAEAVEGRDKPGEGEALPKGWVRLSVDAPEDPGSGPLTVTVEDNGKGLPTGEDRARLTEPYVTTRTKGTGLGLAIVKKILEDHGGDLVLEDGEHGGARISMVFPAARAAAAAAGAPDVTATPPDGPSVSASASPDVRTHSHGA